MKNAPWLRVATGFGVTVILIVGLLLLIGCSVCRDWAFICENTGSQYGYREWFFGVRTNHWYEESRLETFLKRAHPGRYTNRWTSYAGTGRNTLGRAVLHGHGRPGPILHVSGAKLDAYVDGLDDGGKMVLYAVFSSGDRAKIQELAQRIELGRAAPE